MKKERVWRMSHSYNPAGRKFVSNYVEVSSNILCTTVFPLRGDETQRGKPDRVKKLPIPCNHRLRWHRYD